MRKILFCLIVFLRFACAVGAQSDTVIIKSDTRRCDLHQKVAYLSDTTSILHFEELQANANFRDTAESNLNFGFRTSVMWFKINVRNDDSLQRRFYLAINYSSLNYVDFYDVVSGVVRKTVKTGELLSVDTRDVKHRFFVLQLDLKPNETHSVFVRVDSQGDSMIIPLELCDSDVYLQYDSNLLLIEGGVLGFFCLIFLFTIVYLFSMRDSISVAFGGYVFFVIIALLYLDGLLKLLIPESSWFIERILYWSIAGGTICLGAFAWYFLRLHCYWLRYRYVYMGLILLQFVGALLCFFDNPLFYTGLLIVNLSAPLVFILVGIASYIAFQKRYQPALILLLSSSIPGMGVIIFFLRDYGFASFDFFDETCLKITYSLDILLLLIAVIYRLRTIYLASERAITEKTLEVEAQRKQLDVSALELKKLSIITQKTQNSVALFNADGKLAWCNEGFLRMFGFSEKDALANVNLAHLYSNELVPSYMSMVETTNESIQFDSQVFTNDQHKVWVQTTLSPLKNDETNEFQFVTIDSDISSLKVAQLELIMARDNAEEANRLKTAFLSNITHEIRTPLNSIIGFSQLLSVREYPLDRQQKFLQMITTNGNHLLDIISDIIDISKIEAGRMELRPKVFPLNDMLHELIDQYSIQLQNKTLAFQAGIHERDVKLILEAGLENDSAIIFTDQQRLKQVIINLLTNALKFTPSGAVTLGYNKRENEVSEELMFFVRDTGVGMTDDELRIIFQRFRQGNEAVSQHYGGTGLGLSISKGLIDLMGGAIWLESKKNKGTTVYFSVPYIKANTENVHNKQTSSFRFDFSNKVILVVEDEYFNFNVIKEILDETHSTILHAETGAQAFELLEANKNIDIILMDIRLPDISGYEVTRKIRLTNKDIPVIAQTAYATEDVRYLCMKSGCNDYIAKPINPNYMLHLIAKYLNK